MGVTQKGGQIAAELQRRHRGQVRRALPDAAAAFMRHAPDPDLALFICRAASHAVIHQAASERPELLSHPLFAEEVTALLERYLRRG